MSNLKVEGKVADFCPKCKNCKCVTNQYNGTDVMITEVECEDPYDGMPKTLDVDSDICCSMFEPRPNPTHVCYEQEVKTVKPGEKVDIPDHGRYPWGNEKEPCTKISLLQHELEMDKLRRVIIQLGREKADHLKGIERLKKSQEKLQNQVKNLQTTNEESYKREEKLKDKCHKLERRLLDENKRFSRLDSEFLTPLVHTLYPGEKVFKQYSDILEDIKELNKISTYYDRYKTFTDKVQSLLFQDDRIYEFDEIIKEIENLKKTNESLTKMVEKRDRWVDGLQNDVYTLQNEILTIRDIAQKAYDDTNRD